MLSLELKYKLLTVIQQYYPVGLPYLNAKHPGYKELCRILESKINTLFKEEKLEPWASLVEHLQIVFPQKPVYDRAYIQYPSLWLCVELGSQEDSFLKRTTNLHVYISLLAPYYTISLEEYMLPVTYDESLAPSLVSYYKTYQTASIIEKQQYFDKAIESIHVFYPAYTYLDFHAIHSLKIIGAIPHGEDEQTMDVTYPAYDFLFGSGSKSSTLHWV
jgi:hypothetical protein